MPKSETVIDLTDLPEPFKSERICNEIDSLSDDSRTFRVSFVKKDGTIRDLTAQRAMERSRIKGTERGRKASETFHTNNPYKRRLCDIHAKQRGDANPWRTVDAATVTETRINGVTIRWRTVRAC